MTSNERTVEAVAKALEDATEGDASWTDLARAAIEAHEAAEGDEPMRCLKCGRVANVCRPDGEDACTTPSVGEATSSEREALAETIIDAAWDDGPHPDSQEALKWADTILAAGFRRTPPASKVETVEERGEGDFRHCTGHQHYNAFCSWCHVAEANFRKASSTPTSPPASSEGVTAEQARRLCLALGHAEYLPENPCPGCVGALREASIPLADGAEGV